jgi:hypothetical protein
MIKPYHKVMREAVNDNPIVQECYNERGLWIRFEAVEKPRW